MVAENLHHFLIASVGASTSFIGLLFVALALMFDRMPAASTLVGRERALASSLYRGRVTVFFISMVGLILGPSIAWVLASKLPTLLSGQAISASKLQHGH